MIFYISQFLMVNRTMLLERFPTHESLKREVMLSIFDHVVHEKRIGKLILTSSSIWFSTSDPGPVLSLTIPTLSGQPNPFLSYILNEFGIVSNCEIGEENLVLTSSPSLTIFLPNSPPYSFIFPTSSRGKIQAIHTLIKAILQIHLNINSNYSSFYSFFD